MGGGKPSEQTIVALRNEKGSYNESWSGTYGQSIVALRNEKGSYNRTVVQWHG